MENLIYLAPIAGVIAVLFAIYKTVMINKSEVGNEKMKEISGSIAEGAIFICRIQNFNCFCSCAFLDFRIWN